MPLKAVDVALWSDDQGPHERAARPKRRTLLIFVVVVFVVVVDDDAMLILLFLLLLVHNFSFSPPLTLDFNHPHESGI